MNIIMLNMQLRGYNTNMYLVVIDFKVAVVYSSLTLADEFCDVDDWTVMDRKFSLDGRHVLCIAYIQLPHEGYIHAVANNLKQGAHSHTVSCKPDRRCFRAIIRMKRCWASLGYSLEARMMTCLQT
jgi:hypothetical protein